MLTILIFGTSKYFPRRKNDIKIFSYSKLHVSPNGLTEYDTQYAFDAFYPLHIFFVRTSWTGDMIKERVNAY
jgi:hypothetical protein